MLSKNHIKFAELVDEAYRAREKRIQELSKALGLPYRTPFEQAAYDEQFRTRNRVSGPDLADSLTPNINQTKGDFDILVAVVCLVAFIILLIVV